LNLGVEALFYYIIIICLHVNAEYAGGFFMGKSVTEVIMDPVQRERISRKVSLIGISGNLILTVFKLFAGIVAHSGAMVSDAVHSASDTLSGFIVMISMRFATKPADKEHPYGHERIECVAAMILAFVLFLAGGGIGLAGMRKILGIDPVEAPGILALIAAATSIIVKEAMYRYTIYHARLINSSALTAAAWDNRSDALSSVGSFAGILGGVLGFPKLDAVAGVIIAVLIVKVAIGIFMDSVNKMMDRALDPEEEDKIRSLVAETEGVKAVDRLLTRLFGDRSYVEVEIAVDKTLTVEEGHTIAHSVHDRIEAGFPRVKHCNVHVNPYDENRPAREA